MSFLPSQKRLRELLVYEPKTGEFRWRVKRNNCTPEGKKAGCAEPRGYWVISVDNRRFYAHVLAWIWMTGAAPNGHIDHADRNKSNNRWKNLREATVSQNRANNPTRNVLGVKGVWKDHHKWYVRIGGKYLGSFSSLQLAEAASKKASLDSWGEFARP